MSNLIIITTALAHVRVHWESGVDVDVRCPVLVPFLLCHLKGPLWGAVKARGQLHASDTLHVAYWNLTVLLCLALGQGSLTGNPAVTPSGARSHGARPRAIWCDVALTEAKYARCQASRRGVAPHLPALQVPPVPAPWLSFCESLT